MLQSSRRRIMLSKDVLQLASSSLFQFAKRIAEPVSVENTQNYFHSNFGSSKLFADRR